MNDDDDDGYEDNHNGKYIYIYQTKYNKQLLVS